MMSCPASCGRHVETTSGGTDRSVCSRAIMILPRSRFKRSKAGGRQPDRESEDGREAKHAAGRRKCKSTLGTYCGSTRSCITSCRNRVESFTSSRTRAGSNCENLSGSGSSVATGEDLRQAMSQEVRIYTTLKTPPNHKVTPTRVTRRLGLISCSPVDGVHTVTS